MQVSSDRPDLRKAGIYFLFGRDEHDSEVFSVYVGEAEEVLSRLMQHRDKDFWNEAVTFISKDENLNKAHVKFLEYRAYKAIQDAKRAKLKNANTPTCPVISELEQSVMLEFFDNLELLVSTLGYKIFEPLSMPKNETTELYFIQAARGANARAIISNEGVVVLEGSFAADSVTPSAANWVTNIRERLLETEVLINNENKLIFSRDYLFSSPSTAAAIVMGRSANGLQEWKDQAGRSLKDTEAL